MNRARREEKRKEHKSTRRNTTEKLKNGRQAITSLFEHRKNARVPTIPETIPRAGITKNGSPSATQRALPPDSYIAAPLSRDSNFVEYESYPDDDSASSTVLSDIWTESGKTTDSISTTPMAPKAEIASAELVSLLVKHTRLKDLYTPAIKAQGKIGIREALVVILKSYAKALKVHSDHSQQYKAGELVRLHARHISYACVAFHDPGAPDADREERWKDLGRQTVQASSKVEDYLNRLENQTVLIPDRQSGLEDLSDDSDREDVGDPLPNLSKVKVFMTSGPAFEQLCKDVSDLSTQMRDQKGSTFIELTKAKITGEKDQEKSEIEQKRSTFVELTKTIVAEEKDQERLRTDQTGSIPRPEGVQKASNPDFNPGRLFLAMYTLYRVFISWLKSNFWPQINPDSTRVNWTCVGFV